MLTLSDREITASGKYGNRRPESSVCFSPPPDARMEGEKGEALVRWVRQGDGKVQIVSVNGQQLGGTQGNEEPEMAEESAVVEEAGPDEFSEAKEVTEFY